MTSTIKKVAVFAALILAIYISVKVLASRNPKRVEDCTGWCVEAFISSKCFRENSVHANQCACEDYNLKLTSYTDVCKKATEDHNTKRASGWRHRDKVLVYYGNGPCRCVELDMSRYNKTTNRLLLSVKQISRRRLLEKLLEVSHPDSADTIGILINTLDTFDSTYAKSIGEAKNRYQIKASFYGDAEECMKQLDRGQGMGRLTRRATISLPSKAAQCSQRFSSRILTLNGFLNVDRWLKTRGNKLSTKGKSKVSNLVERINCRNRSMVVPSMLATEYTTVKPLLEKYCNILSLLESEQRYCGIVEKAFAVCSTQEACRPDVVANKGIDHALSLVENKLPKRLISVTSRNEVKKTYKHVLAKRKSLEDRIVGKVIRKLYSRCRTVREGAVKRLSEMQNLLSKSSIRKLIGIMRHGTRKWTYRDFGTWYERRSIRYYAAQVLTESKSKHITSRIRAQAERAMKRGTRSWDSSPSCSYSYG